MDSVNPPTPKLLDPSLMHQIAPSDENPIKQIFLEMTTLSHEMNQRFDSLEQTLDRIDVDLNYLESSVAATTVQVQNASTDVFPGPNIVNLIENVPKKNSRPLPDVNPEEPAAKKKKGKFHGFPSQQQYLISKMSEHFESAMRDHREILKGPQGLTTPFLSKNYVPLFKDFRLELIREVSKIQLTATNSFFDFALEALIKKNLNYSIKFKDLHSKISTMEVYRSLDDKGSSYIGDPFITTFIGNMSKQFFPLTSVGTVFKSVKKLAYEDSFFSMKIDQEGQKINYYNLNMGTLEIVNSLVRERDYIDLPSYDQNELLQLIKPAFSISNGVREDFIPLQRFIFPLLGRKDLNPSTRNIRFLSSFIVPAYIEEFVTSRKFYEETNSSYSPVSNGIDTFLSKLEKLCKIGMNLDCPELRNHLLYILESFRRLHPNKRFILEGYLEKLTDNSTPDPESNRLYREAKILLGQLPEVIPEYKGILYCCQNNYANSV